MRALGLCTGRGSGAKVHRREANCMILNSRAFAGTCSGQAGRTGKNYALESPGDAARARGIGWRWQNFTARRDNQGEDSFPAP